MEMSACERSGGRGALRSEAQHEVLDPITAEYRCTRRPQTCRRHAAQYKSITSQSRRMMTSDGTRLAISTE